MFFNILKKLSKDIETSFSVMLPSSKEMIFGESYGSPAFQVVLNNQKAFNALMSGSELKISEAYIYGDIDLRGNVDMFKLLEIKNLFSKARPFIMKLLKMMTALTDQISINKKSIAKHYEFDHDFYLTFLDKTRAYSHGIFANDDEPCEKASLRKLNFAMNSCHLTPDAKVLDIGTGWGTLVEFLGKKKFQVDALTIADQSERFISQLIADKKLANCQVFKKDFLAYEPAGGKIYDALFSLGTLEHFPNYKQMLQKCGKLLKKGGYAYFDASASVPDKSMQSDFITRHIFPGNHKLLDIFGFLEAVKDSCFELVFLANDTHNYYLTLKAWAENLDHNKQEIIQKWGETLYRKFQLYFWGCCYGMFTNKLQAYRVVLRKC